jgi:2-oxo-4-hydroxy-4-carboxy-5-ureidoimidazoline decarboxylase
LRDPPLPPLAELNGGYLARFGFPFILCVRRHTAASVLAVFQRRLQAGPADERETALREIGLITRLRLADRVTGPGLPETCGWLTMHVLDTSLGRPTAGGAVTLLEVGRAAPVMLAEGITDHQGRTSRPLLHDGPLRIGLYELRFDVGTYFSDRLAEQPAFLNVVSVRFAIRTGDPHASSPVGQSGRLHHLSRQLRQGSLETSQRIMIWFHCCAHRSITKYMMACFVVYLRRSRLLW